MLVPSVIDAIKSRKSTPAEPEKPKHPPVGETWPFDIRLGKSRSGPNPRLVFPTLKGLNQYILAYDPISKVGIVGSSGKTHARATCDCPWLSSGTSGDHCVISLVYDLEAEERQQ